MANVLCVAAHPDDEVLGAGATLAKHAQNGDDVLVKIMARRDLLDNAMAASRTLGYNPVVSSDFPDQRFDSIELLKLICFAEWSVDPDIVYTHWPGDLNLDHALTARAVLTAFRPKPDTRKRTILAMETLSSTEWGAEPFPANWYVEVNASQMIRKCEALKCYTTEIQNWRHPRSPHGVYNQAERRGYECGAVYAEAFHVLRHSE